MSQYSNYGGATLADAFPFTSATQTQPYCASGVVAPFCDSTGAKRNGNWAFDIWGVNAATQIGVPEPSTWAMMIVGFGAIGGVFRRRTGWRIAASA
ncbi:MAG: PEP-CTERM sorting domain-containing protein [Sphingomonas sp.]|nr:PEP-CTERM sorting domain-containing protein [Sphingomonas sp.]